MDIARAQPAAQRRLRLPWVLGAVAVLALTLGLSRLKSAAPSVGRESVWMDVVQRGPMVREVRGPGALVPEHPRWITAETSGRVEALKVVPGSTVKAGTVLVVLSNPDVVLQSLEADRQLAQAEGMLLNLKSTLGSQALQEESAVVTLKTELGAAQRQAKATEDLEQRDVVGELETRTATEKAEELQARMKLAQDRLHLVNEGVHDQLAAQRTQVERLRAVAQFRKQQVAAMEVVAGADGTLSELPLELGQWVTPGTMLAKVVQPEKLKAELRVAETQARDLTVGQVASIDTHNGIIQGRVSRVAPAAAQGSVKIDVALEGALPKGARPDLNVEGTIVLEKLDNVLHVGRPAGVQSEGVVELFKLTPGADEAQRVKVRLGRMSVSTVEVLEGLSAGDHVVLSDMNAYANAERLRLK